MEGGTVRRSLYLACIFPHMRTKLNTVPTYEKLQQAKLAECAFPDVGRLRVHTMS
jgi:hypothetical protein